MRRSELNSHQRAGQITVFLIQGNKLTTAEIARLTGLGNEGARKMMLMLAIILPITNENGRWMWVRDEIT